MRKKKLVFQSDFALANTGFGRNTKALLEYLYKTDKYDIVNYAVGLNWSNPNLEATPWKSIGTLPDSQEELNRLNQDPNQARRASYGDYNLNRIIEQEKPDVYIAVQDIWGVDFAIEKPWFNKITSVLWTTLDSLPILPTAIAAAPKAKNYWIWSNFATKALNEMGHKNVTTMHGCVEDKSFFRFLNSQKKDLRSKHKIDQEDFVVGFVFRNQLRKSVPNLLEGFSIFQKENPKLKTKLLLHTHYGEGWNIKKLAEEYGVKNSDILTTYICKSCKGYSVRPHTSEDEECPYCKNKTFVTTGVSVGVTEDQLNEIYNLMDVYCHPFTSGGQEIPIQEAKLSELITLVTNYSCGEEMCEEGANSLPLEWSEYREHGTEFIKASTNPRSVAKQLQKVLEMSEPKKREMEKAARKWALENFSPNVIGKKIEEFIDNAPFVESFDFKEEEQNPHAQIGNIEDNSEWIKSLYANILKRVGVDEKDDGHKYWMNEIQKGTPRQQIDNYFRQVASQHNQKNKKVVFEDFLSKDDDGKRILYVMPGSLGNVYLSTALFKSIKEQYPGYNLYVAVKPEYAELLLGNPHVHKVLNYVPQMDNLLWLEGSGEHNGYFEIAFLPHASTQKIVSYLHNGKSNIAYDLSNEKKDFAIIDSSNFSKQTACMI
jgi:glycosyltransferase involved in cell wall biosynthesis